MYKYKNIVIYDDYHNIVGIVKEKPHYPIYKSSTSNYEVSKEKVLKMTKNNKKSLK
jgi:hypothetical protein